MVWAKDDPSTDDEPDVEHEAARQESHHVGERFLQGHYQDL